MAIGLMAGAVYLMYFIADQEDRSPLLWAALTFVVSFLCIGIGLSFLGPIVAVIVVYLLMFLANAIQR